MSRSRSGPALAEENSSRKSRAASPTAPRSRGLSQVDLVAIALLCAIGAFVAFYALDSKALKGDEATSYFIAHLDWPRLLRSLATSEANASLFYLTLHYWIELGRSELVLRVLPALFGTVTVPLLYVLTTRLFGPVQGVAAALLLATNAFFIKHVQEVRGYSLSAMLGAASTLLFVELMRRRTRLTWAGYVLAGGLGLYAHFFVAWVLLAHVASLAFLRRRDIPVKSLAAAYLCIAVLAAPLAYFVAFRDVGQVDWIGEHSLWRLEGAWRSLTGGGPVLPYAYAVLFAIALGGLVSRTRRTGRTPESWAQALVILWALLPIGTAFGISYLKPLFIPRYLLVTVPALAVVATMGLTALGPRRLLPAVTAAMVVLGAIGLVGWYTTESKDSWELRADYIAENSDPGDGLVLYSPTAIRPFGYYAGYYDSGAAAETVPPPIYPPLYWLGYSATQFNPNYEAIVSEVAEHDRVWLVEGYARDETRLAEKRELLAVLKEQCRRISDRAFRTTLKLFSGCDD
jgi:mannosyltransferase